MKRRKAIEMTTEERDAFLRDTRTIALSTLDQHGYPHSVAMWYVMEDGCCLMTTYAKSQKAVNVRRNPKVAVLAESGQTYDTLKGVLLRGRAELVEDLDTCVRVLTSVHRKMMGALPAGVEDALKLP